MVGSLHLPYILRVCDVLALAIIRKTGLKRGFQTGDKRPNPHSLGGLRLRSAKVAKDGPVAEPGQV